MDVKYIKQILTEIECFVKLVTCSRKLLSDRYYIEIFSYLPIA